MKDKVLETVAQTIAQYDMLKPGESVLVALSGGADSVALTLSLKTLGYEVQAFHLNHQLRGEESERDVRFVQRFCREEGIALTLETADITRMAQREHKGIEETARQERYQLLRMHARSLPIATAHNLNDNTETVLLNLARGTAGRGLCGIPPVRGNIIRPLLHVTRADIETYLRALGQQFVTDSTNIDTAFARNRIRHEAVPALEQVNPKLHETVLRMTQQLRLQEQEADARAMHTLMQAKCNDAYDRPVLLGLSQGELGRVVHQICIDSGISQGKLTAKHVDAVCALIWSTAPNAAVHLPQGFEAVRAYDRIFVALRKLEMNAQEMQCSIIGAGLYSFLGKAIVVRQAKEDDDFNKSFNTFCIDCDTIEHETVIMRTRRAGDRIRLTQNGGSRSLKKCMIDRKIAARERSTCIVLADQTGIIAAEGIGQQIDRKPITNCVMIIEIQGDNNHV